MVACLTTAGYFQYKILNTTCLLSDLKPSYSAYCKTAMGRLMGMLCVVLLMVRFFLPPETVFRMSFTSQPSHSSWPASSFVAFENKH